MHNGMLLATMNALIGQCYISHVISMNVIMLIYCIVFLCVVHSMLLINFGGY